MSEEDVWLKRWNTLKNWLVDYDEKNDEQDERSLLSVREIQYVMEQIEVMGEEE